METPPVNRTPDRRIPLLLVALVAGLPIAAYAQQPGAAADAPKKVQTGPGPSSSPRAIVTPPGSKTPITTPPPAAGPPGGRLAPQPSRANTSPPSAQPITQPGQGRPAGQPPAAEKGVPINPQHAGDDEYILGESSEAIDLKTIVEWVAGELQINIVASEDLSGSVILNAPQVIRKDQLLPFLDSLLEQYKYTIVEDRPGFYRIIKAIDVGVQFEGGTTRIIPTPAVRPSSLQELIHNQLGILNQTMRITYLDDLGVIVVTDTPRRVQTVQDLVDRMLARSQQQQFIRFDLTYLAAVTARTRILDLLGTPEQNPLSAVMQQVPPNPQAGAITTGAMTNLSDRLSVDAQGNALILRGFPDEADRIGELLSVIDRPITLEYHQYYVGAGALAVAQQAERQGLGSVETIEIPTADTQPQTGAVQRPVQPAQNLLQNVGLGQPQLKKGGPVMLVDETRGTILYYGTQAQQAEMDSLVKILDVERDEVVIEGYKVKNVQADLVAEIIQALLTNEPVTETASGFLPGGRERRGGSRRSGSSSGDGFDLMSQFGFGGDQTGAGGGRRGRNGQTQQNGTGISSFGDDTVFVVADRANNQILVKAPQRQQPDFAKLIERLDQRRAQVYIEVQIVSISDTDTFRLAVESQLINAGGTGGAINTNFGLGTFDSSSTTGETTTTTTGNFTDPNSVKTTLGGITAAIIKSDMVPIVINAIKNETDGRILSSPQLLVDDNETAEIVSLEEQPTTTQSQGAQTTLTSFQDYQSAGTSLLVQPSISEAGYMRLYYDIELSNFVGTSSSAGVPPPKQTRNVNSDSVTIPDGTTIVVGGITVNSKNRTIAKVPLLGDIPLLGVLFRDTNKNSSNQRLYVFITPRILRDPNFRDLILLTKGPQADAGIAEDFPELKPLMIEMLPAGDSPGETYTPSPPARREDEPSFPSRREPDPAANPDPRLEPLPEPVTPPR
jgi:type II secretory pathway component GspD/PulD (secretin)